MSRGNHWKRVIAVLLAGLTLLSATLTASAEVETLPGVTAEMTKPAWWAAKVKKPEAVLADAAAIADLNAGILHTADCRMYDLHAPAPDYDGALLQRNLTQEAMRTVADFYGTAYYNAEGENLRYDDALALLDAIAGARPDAAAEARYGVCVKAADVRALPTGELITDEKGDRDYDVLQLSALRVNEPVVIRAQSADGNWYYCETSCVPGWVAAEDVAVCADREEWLSAWDIPDEEAIVVTQGKLFLDEANVNAASSGRMLSMGTVLRRVRREDYDPSVTNRALYQNYAVTLPVRLDDGSYGTTTALIPQHQSVSEGYLPLTTENLLEVAFSMLGDAYGWGGMLSVPDCSLYIRNLYKCFGLELPRNTVWQGAMPAEKYELSGLTDAEKAAVLDGLAPGAILFFNGHEMLYLGEEGGRHYVLSAVSSMMDAAAEKRIRVRSVVLNTLEDTRRANGNTWLQDLNLAVLPWRSEAAARTQTLLRELITYRGCYGEKADAKVQELLEELDGLDARQGALWREIMACWDYANKELPVHLEALPDDLPADDSLCIAVLGFELNNDGSMKDELIGRLETALHCAEQYPNALVVCTGGGTAKDNPLVTEAGLMGQWLLDHGLDKSRLVIEDRSLTTAQNAEFSYAILLREHPQVKSVAIVSSSYHIPWGSLLFEAAFLRSASENGTPEVHVVSNCGYPIENDKYRADELLRWETGGLLQMIGEQELAMRYYFDYDAVEKPPLEEAAETAKAA